MRTFLPGSIEPFDDTRLAEEMTAFERSDAMIAGVGPIFEADGANFAVVVRGIVQRLNLNLGGVNEWKYDQIMN